MAALAAVMASRPPARSTVTGTVLHHARVFYEFYGVFLVAFAIVSAACLFPAPATPMVQATDLVKTATTEMGPLIVGLIVLIAAVSMLWIIHRVGNLDSSKSSLWLTILFASSSISLTFSALWPLVDHVFIRMALALVIGTFWIVGRTWWKSNIVAFIAAYGYLTSWTITDLRILTAIAVALLLHDGYAVWRSGRMIEVAKRVRDSHIPILIELPGAGMIGLGDVAVPGLIIMAAIPFGSMPIALAAYAVGGVMCSIIRDRSERGVPALCFLVPCVLAGVFSSEAARAALFLN